MTYKSVLKRLDLESYNDYPQGARNNAKRALKWVEKNGWGSCGDDNVSDTPTQEQENYSCPAFPKNPNSCSTSNPHGDMFMNYMDYTNDACMNMFTNGQKIRMLSAINQYRPNMLNHNLCVGSVEIQENISTKKELIKIR